MPAELIHIALAERFGCSPIEVLEWPDSVVEDALLYLGATGANSRAGRGQEY